VLLIRLLEERGKGAGRYDSLLDLALWDFVRDNASKQPLCFAGISSEWLTARAQVSGCVLVYPRQKNPAPSRLEALLKDVFAARTLTTDPGVAQTVCSLLLPLAECARRQNRIAEARRFARLATIIQPDDPQAWLTLARAAARAGKKQETMEFAAGRLNLLAGGLDDQALSDLLREDLERYAIAEAFEAELDRECQGIPQAEAREEIAGKLWDADELAVLNKGYIRLLEVFPDDPDIIYQRAAVLAQLGDLAGARKELVHWIRTAQVPEAEMVACIEEDGRFALLRSYEPKESKPASPQGAQENPTAL
jgi:hypothetical protein